MSNTKLSKNNSVNDADRIDPELFKWLDNDFVDDEKTYGKKLGYTKDAYVAMAKYLFDEGKTPVEAYCAMGFDPDILGESAANVLAQRAKNLYDKDPEFTKKKSSYDGAIELEKMPTLTLEEQIAFLEARNDYLRELIRAGKEIEKILKERILS